jgi:hypothetical protein
MTADLFERESEKVALEERTAPSASSSYRISLTFRKAIRHG